MAFQVQHRDGRTWEGAGLRIGGEYPKAPKWSAEDALGFVRSVMRFQRFGVELEVIIGETEVNTASVFLDSRDVASVDLATLCAGCSKVIPKEWACSYSTPPEPLRPYHHECKPRKVAP